MNGQSNRLDWWSGGTQARNFLYDTVGNVASEARWDGSRAYSFDAFNRMSKVFVNNVQVGDYGYNAFNQRVYKSTTVGATRALYGPAGELLAEIGPQTTSYVWAGGELLGVYRNGQFYASHTAPYPIIAQNQFKII